VSPERRAQPRAIKWRLEFQEPRCGPLAAASGSASSDQPQDSENMTTDEQSIIDLTRENGRLKRENEELKRAKLNAEIAMRKVGVPSYFEDGNDGDDLSFTEQVSILCDMYEREKSRQTNQGQRLRRAAWLLRGRLCGRSRSHEARSSSLHRMVRRVRGVQDSRRHLPLSGGMAVRQ